MHIVLKSFHILSQDRCILDPYYLHSIYCISRAHTERVDEVRPQITYQVHLLDDSRRPN